MEDNIEIIKETVEELTNSVISSCVATLQDTTVATLQDTTVATLQDTTVVTLQDTTVVTLQDTTVVSLQDTYVPVKNPFSFINNPEKMSLLAQVNNALHIDKFPTNKLVFVYSGPKVGSTSIVSSMRLFGTDRFSVIHIHDEEMLKVLGHINGITVNEIILYNKHLGKNVYVIDVFRSPIERKISTYFEKIGAYHFNNTDQNVNIYNIHRSR
jgi:hypothetical protein